MGAPDYVIMIGYAVGLFVIGGIFARRMKTASDMFKAGGQSPWWVSGLSGYMTMFSAGTFVVWGGIAYRLGLVAVMINLCYGVAALLVGYTVAGYWRRLGIATPAEFTELRYGRAAVLGYIAANIIYKMFGIAVALYSVAKLFSALVPLAEGNPLRDPATGMFDVGWAVLAFGLVVVIYTVVGGLWAVLMTDVLQFIVLTLAVLFVAPLILGQAGGIGGMIAQAPEGFFAPVAGDYTWTFIAGWVAIHYFMVGAEWAFVQRYLCVPTQRDARKSAYLFGVLYLISPVIWMLPPMAYRVIAPGVDPETAYIQACQSVLPIGMVGFMMAAMYSATASSLSGILNVFAGVLTYDFYKALVAPRASESHLVFVGRGMTVLLGVVLILLALAVPAMGGATKVVLTAASLLVGPLLLPTMAGMISPRLKQSAVWATMGICFPVGVLVVFGLGPGGWFAAAPATRGLAAWVQSNTREVELFVGLVLPALVLGVLHMTSRTVSEGWHRIQACRQRHVEHAPVEAAHHLPVVMVAWSMLACALVMAALIPVNPERWLLMSVFAAVCLGVAGIAWWFANRIQQLQWKDVPHVDHAAVASA